MEKLTFILQNFKNWLPIAVAILVIALILDFTSRMILRFLSKKLKKSKDSWVKLIVKLLPMPISIFIWVVSFSLILNLILSYAEYSIPVSKLASIAIIISLLWVAMRWKNEFKPILKKKVKESKTTIGHSEIEALGKAFSVCIWAISIIWVMAIFEIPISTLIAFGGAGGIVAGFALKNIIANFFSGFMIYMTKPFQLGDWIQIPGHNVEGTVEESGWYLTKVRSFEKRPIYVPNALFANSIVINPSRMTNRRINETIGIRYQDFNVIKDIVADIEKMINEHPDVDQDHLTVVNFKEFAASSLDILVYAFTKTIDRKESQAVKQGILIKIGEIIDSHGAEIAFPTRTLDLPQEFIKKF